MLFHKLSLAFLKKIYLNPYEDTLSSTPIMPNEVWSETQTLAQVQAHRESHKGRGTIPRDSAGDEQGVSGAPLGTHMCAHFKSLWHAIVRDTKR